MKFVLYTNSVSAHQLPLARELVRLMGAENFRYVYAAESAKGNQRVSANEPWIMRAEGARKLLEDAEVMLVGGVRPLDLLERRLKAGRLTLFMSERWFKPVTLLNVRWNGLLHQLTLPGWVRLFYPRFFRMARRFVRLFRSEHFRYLPIGPWSDRDMRLLCRIFGVTIQPPQIIPWGDFVEPSKFDVDGGTSSTSPEGAESNNLNNPNNRTILRLLWVGRFLDWKRVDTLIAAVRQVENVTLDLYGAGPEEAWLRKISKGCSRIRFFPPVPIEQVRGIMREHDLYVLPSSAYEGWGCVVNEALEEGMRVLGTHEAGASAAILPHSNLFSCGDWRRLAELLATGAPAVSIEKWTAKAAAVRLREML